MFLQASVILSTGGGMRGCRGVCVVFQGACMVGGVCGCMRGVCMVVGGCIEYDQIRSMSRWYTSYWNAFLYYKY